MKKRCGWTSNYFLLGNFIIPVQGFFTLYRNLFSRLHADEKTFESECDLPSFGYSTWNWAVPKEDEGKSVRSFYNEWLQFTTEKDFAWMDQWNIAEAPERRARR
jgi:DnaJ family protein A protein 5